MPETLATVFTERERKLAEANNLYMARVLAARRLRDEQGLSLRDIGKALDLSHEWVRQLLKVR